MDFVDLIDLDFVTWYPQGLPPSLAEAFGEKFDLPGLGDFDDMALPDFGGLLADSLYLCHDPRLSYHNLAHAQRVTHNGAEALEAIQTHLGVRWALGFVQAVLLGLSQHDLGHPGAAFFADAPRDRVPLDIDDQTSVEWCSARLFDEFAMRAGIPDLQRLMGVYTIWSSTYGTGTERGKAMGLDRIQPRGLIGRLMRAADVAISGDYTVSVHDTANLFYGEVPPIPAPTTLAEYLRDREGFLGYVGRCYELLNEAAGFSLTEHLGWQANLRRHNEDLVAIRHDDSVKLAILQSQLRICGITLD